jgi:hypothetical protein
MYKKKANHLILIYKKKKKKKKTLRDSSLLEVVQKDINPPAHCITREQQS